MYLNPRPRLTFQGDGPACGFPGVIRVVVQETRQHSITHMMQLDTLVPRAWLTCGFSVLPVNTAPRACP